MSPPAPPPTLLLSKRHKRAIAISLCLAAGFYLVVVLASGYDNILSAVQRVSPLIWVMLLGCSFTSYLLRFSRWQYYLRLSGYRLAVVPHFIYYLAGFALTTTPGKTGEIVRAVLLRPHGVPYTQTIATFFTERFLDVVVITALATLATLAFADYATLIIGLAVLIVLTIPILRFWPLHVRLRHWQQRRQPSRLKRTLWHVLMLLRKARRLFAPSPLYLGLGIGVLAWGIQGLAFSALLTAMQLDITLGIALGIYATSLFVGAASFIPGGIGTTEATMYILLKSVGADEMTAISVPLISRLCTLWFAVSLGLISASYLSLRRPASQ